MTIKYQNHEFKGTAGEWEAGDGQGNGGRYFVYSDDVTGSAICHSELSLVFRSREEKMANTQLIAAGPKLLRALIDMMPEHTGYGNSMDWHKYNAAVKQARATILQSLGANK